MWCQESQRINFKCKQLYLLLLWLSGNHKQIIHALPLLQLFLFLRLCLLQVIDLTFLKFMFTASFQCLYLFLYISSKILFLIPSCLCQHHVFYVCVFQFMCYPSRVSVCKAMFVTTLLSIHYQNPYVLVSSNILVVLFLRLCLLEAINVWISKQLVLRCFQVV